MSSEVRIPAEPRTEFGKGFARRTRRAGKVPAVLYGHGEAPRHLALPARELAHAFKGEAGANVLLRLELADSAELALPRQIQRDPLRGDLTHVDLLLVRRGETVAVDVPIVIVGDIPAVKTGGLLDQQATTLHVQADATQIPTQIEVDGSQFTEVGSSLHAGEITLPEGVTLLTDPEAIVIHIVGAPTEAEFEAELAEAAAELAPAVEVEPEAAAEGGEAPAEDASDS
ncbi:MAG TPA: 50S ribosomal protein L25/general stress protein Ctc [Mycobacteriales bacterium]|nr:50S ribosomal protein L25/general stress protein Ctc [Mycobacteriales bacterium]